MFIDRRNAAGRLAEQLADYTDSQSVIIAIPNGGAAIGYTLAEVLQLPLTVVQAKKIGARHNREYAIGAVGLTSEIFTANTYEDDVYIKAEVARLRALLQQRHQEYKAYCSQVELQNSTLILVDDGIATGFTILMCIQLLRREKPAKIIVAVPVASAEALAKIRSLADEVVCLETPQPFLAVGYHYQKFEQISDNEVVQILQKAQANRSKLT